MPLLQLRRGVYRMDRQVIPLPTMHRIVGPGRYATGFLRQRRDWQGGVSARQANARSIRFAGQNTARTLE